MSENPASLCEVTWVRGLALWRILWGWMAGHWLRVRNLREFSRVRNVKLGFRFHKGSRRRYLDVGTETSALVSYSLTGPS